MKPNRSKYNVDLSPAGKARRIREMGDILPSLVGRYDSDAEARRADEISILVFQEIYRRAERQIPVRLTDTYSPRIDFKIWGKDEKGRPCVWYEEVKGAPTREFGRLKRHWKDKGPAPLLVYWYQGKGKPWRIERIEGRRDGKG